MQFKLKFFINPNRDFDIRLMTDNVVNKQFYELFKQKDRFIRFAYYYVLDHEASEDLVMDSFMYYWENREKIDVNGNLKAYILRVVKHKCLDYLKLQRIHNEAHEKMRADALWDLNKNIASLEQLEPYKIMTEDYHKIVTNAVKQLPDKTREIFIMSRVKNMKNREIAEKMGVSEKTIEYHMTKAVKFLRTILKELYILTFFIV